MDDYCQIASQKRWGSSCQFNVRVKNNFTGSRSDVTMCDHGSVFVNMHFAPWFTVRQKRKLNTNHWDKKKTWRIKQNALKKKKNQRASVRSVMSDL